MSQSTIRNNLRFDYDQHAWAVLVGFQMGRLEFIFNNQSFDPEMNRMLEKTQVEIIDGIKPVLQAKRVVLHDNVDEYQQMTSALVRDLELLSSRVFSFYMVGTACIRISMATTSPTKAHEIIPLARSCIESIPSQYLQDKEEFFQELLKSNFEAIVHITDYLTDLSQKSVLLDQRDLQRAEADSRKEHQIKFTDEPGFSEEYLLFSSDEQAVRKLFDATVLKLFSKQTSYGWYIVSENGWMNLCQKDKTVKPELLKTFLDESKLIYEKILKKYSIMTGNR